MKGQIATHHAQEYVPQAFEMTKNASNGVQRAEKHFAEQLKAGKIGVDDKGKLNTQMILGKMEEWIKLLVATLKNQDPTEPVDNKDMIAQFGTFAQTMGINEIKTFIEDLKRMMGTTQVIEAAQQLDKLAKVEADSYFYKKDRPLGLSFDMPAEAKKGTVMISDATNRVVRVFEGDFKAGENHFIWDGKNTAGESMEEGKYKFFVIPVDENNLRVKEIDGTPMAVKTYVNGIIHGGEVTPSGAKIKINGLSYPLSDLRSLDLIKLQEAPQKNPDKNPVIEEDKKPDDAQLLQQALQNKIEDGLEQS